MRQLDNCLEVDDMDVKEIIRIVHLQGISPRQAVVKYLDQHGIKDEYPKILMPNAQVIRIIPD